MHQVQKSFESQGYDFSTENDRFDSIADNRQNQDLGQVTEETISASQNQVTLEVKPLNEPSFENHKGSISTEHIYEAMDESLRSPAAS